MEASEKVAIVRMMTPVGTANLEDEAIVAYLEAAEQSVMNRLYPFVDVAEIAMPERFDFAQIRIAVYNINKRGAEGETKHIEVGTERDFVSADIPDELMREIVPMCGTPV